MPGFDWLTEEEDGWDAPTPLPAVASGNRRRKVAAILTLAALALAGLLFTYRQLEQQGRMAEERIREDIAHTHRLLWQAAADRDEELFNSLLAVRDSPWEQVQQNVFQSGLLFDRLPLGITLQPTYSQSLSITLALAPGLDRTIVSFPALYAAQDEEGRSVFVELEHQLAFRSTERGWRLVDFGEDYWGDWMRAESDGMLVVYPAVEGPLGARLARDLQQIWRSYCLGIGQCPANVEVQIRFETSLNGLSQPAVAVFGPELRITLGLPTPTLVGRPLDEAGYQALLRGYARRIVGHFIERRQIPDEMAAFGAYRLAFIQRKLVDAGLAPWPAAEETPLPEEATGRPEAHLITACLDASGQATDLRQFDFQTNEWRTIWSGDPVLSMQSLPDKSGVLLQTLRRPLTQQVHLWRPEGDVTTWTGDYRVVPDSAGPGVTLYSLSMSPTGEDLRVADLAGCHAGHCETMPWKGGPVSAWSPDGQRVLYQSHDSREIILDPGDGSGAVAVGPVGHAFWITNDQYGLITTPDWTERIEQHLITGSVTDRVRRAVLSTNELIAALPASDQEVLSDLGLFVFDAAADPTGSGSIYILAGSGFSLSSSYYGAQSGFYLFGIHFDQEPVVRLIADMKGGSVSLEPMRLSPDGQYVTLQTLQSAGNRVNLHLINLQTGRHRTFLDAALFDGTMIAPDWTSDGTWFAFSNRGALYMLSPSTRYDEVIRPPVPGCAFAAWLER